MAAVETCPVCSASVLKVTSSLVTCPDCGVEFVPEDAPASLFATDGSGRCEAQEEIPLDGAFRQKYRLIRVLGSGGMGTVYLARDLAGQRPVAVKFVRRASQQILARFSQEVRLMARISHPNVVKVHGAGEQSAFPFLVTEYVEGGSLRDWMVKGQIPVPEALRIVRDVLEGLHACHMEGIVHRDLKPENVLLTAAGSSKIADFGIAKAYGDLARDLTATGELLGTPRYMSPEQVKGEPAGVAADIHGAGVILYELLSGRPPYEAPSVPMLMRMVVERDPVPLRELAPAIPPALASLVHRALAKRPGDRPGSARELCSSLEPSFRDAGALRGRGSNSPDSLDAPWERPWIRHFLVPGGLMVLALLGIAGGLARHGTTRVTDGPPGSPVFGVEETPAIRAPASPLRRLSGEMSRRIAPPASPGSPLLPLWSRELEGIPIPDQVCQPMIENQALIVAARTATETRVHALATENGRVLWTTARTAAEDQGKVAVAVLPFRVVVGNPTGGFSVLHRPSGRTLSVQAARPVPAGMAILGYQSSVFDYESGTVCLGGPGLIATARLPMGWPEAGDPGGPTAEIIMIPMHPGLRIVHAGGGTAVTQDETGEVTIFDLPSGRPLWIHTPRGSLTTAGATTNRVLLAAGGLSVFDRATGEFLVEVAIPGPVRRIEESAGRIYILHGDQELSVHDALDMTGIYRASPVRDIAFLGRTRPIVVLRDRAGLLWALRTRDGEPIGRWMTEPPAPGQESGRLQLQHSKVLVIGAGTSGTFRVLFYASPPGLDTE